MVESSRFCSRSQPTTRPTLSSEWRTFLNVSAGMDRDARVELLREMAGGSWAPRSDEEFDAVSRVLLNAGR